MLQKKNFFFFLYARQTTLFGVKTLKASHMEDAKRHAREKISGLVILCATKSPYTLIQEGCPI